MVASSNVHLRPVGLEDLERFVRWFNDPDVTKFLDLTLPLSEDQEREWLESLMLRRDTVVFVIEDSNQQPVGTVGLSGINTRHRHAMLGLTIGETGEWGKGYGTEAVRQLLAYAFGELGLEKVSLHVHADHTSAIHIYEKCGFRREGLLRREKIRQGQFVDELAMAILRPEWEALPAAVSRKLATSAP